MESLSLQGGRKSTAAHKKGINNTNIKDNQDNSYSDNKSPLSDLDDDENYDSECDDDAHAGYSSTITTPESLEREDFGTTASTKIRSDTSKTPILKLPYEILDIIFSHIPKPFPVDLIYVCKRFYHQALPYIYESPVLNGRNYAKFVATISGNTNNSASTNQILKGNKGFVSRSYTTENSSGKDLGSYVKVLDLHDIIQSGKNSYTARVLRRCAQKLTIFIAPQTSFGYAPLLSLRCCSQLKILDLSLVSETVDLRLLFSAINNAQNLEKLAFPRSSIFCHEYNNIWPPKLWDLRLSGGICNDFILSTTFPTTVTHLTITHCPFISGETVMHLCSRLANQLHTLKVFYPMPALRPDALDSVLNVCHELRSFSVAVDYVSRHLLDDIETYYDPVKGKKVANNKLVHFALDSSGMLGQAHKMDPLDVSLAILEDRLPALNKIQVSYRLGWNPKSEDMMELADILQDRDGGVWISS